MTCLTRNLSHLLPLCIPQNIYLQPVFVLGNPKNNSRIWAKNNNALHVSNLLRRVFRINDSSGSISMLIADIVPPVIFIVSNVVIFFSFLLLIVCLHIFQFVCCLCAIDAASSSPVCTVAYSRRYMPPRFKWKIFGTPANVEIFRACMCFRLVSWIPLDTAILIFTRG